MDTPSNGSCRGPLLLRCHNGAISQIKENSDATEPRKRCFCRVILTKLFSAVLFCLPGFQPLV